ncbi:MAG: hypothetical protein U0625_06360 [Phycisphaerales bacterium]
MFGIGGKRSGKVGGLFGRPRRRALIAADFGRSGLRLLQLATADARDGYRCTAATEIPGWMLGSEQESVADGTQTRRVHESLKRHHFAAERISITLPAECFRTDMARLPEMPDAELAESVAFEAQDRFGIDRNDSLISHLRLGAASGGQSEVLVAALPREIAKAATDVVNCPQAAAVHLEHAALASLRAVRRQRLAECPEAEDSTDFGVIHLEERLATLLVLRRGELCFFRSILGDWATNEVSEQRTRATAIPMADQPASVAIPIADTSDNGSTAWRWCSLAEEVLRCLRTIERSANGWWPREIVITGPGARDPQAAAMVESVCVAKASMAVPTRLLKDAPAVIHGNTWIAAIGAACSELDEVRDEARIARAASKPADTSITMPDAVTGATRRDPPTVVTSPGVTGIAAPAADGAPAAATAAAATAGATAVDAAPAPATDETPTAGGAR